MKKTIILSGIALIILSFIFYKAYNSTSYEKIRAQHTAYLNNSPYKETLTMSKKERKAHGIPPNKYFEREWELTINPYTGRPTPENLTKIYTELKKGTYKSLPGDYNNHWTERGPNNVGGRVKAVLFDPNDPNHETVFAGGVSGGLWKNTNISNFNSQWELIESTTDLNVTSITVDPNNSQIFYIGTGESYTFGHALGNGLWKSEDGGNTWTKTFGDNAVESEYQTDALLTVNSPASIADDYIAFSAAFGPDLTTLSGDLILANPEEACEALTNPTEVNGKIAVIKRGNCQFVQKVKFAQEAGAIAVIVINNAYGYPIAMSGSDDTITIPSVMISMEDGDKILNAMSSETVNVTVTPHEPLEPNIVLIPGKSQINDVIAVNNNGSTEIYTAVGDSQYAETSAPTIVGSDAVGVYKSTDNGATWEKLNIPTIGLGDTIIPNDLEYTTDNTIWLSSTYSPLNGKGGGAILSCTDGENFVLKHSIASGGRTEITTSHQNPNRIYAACSVNNSSTPVKLLRTDDAFDSVVNLSLPVDTSGIPDSDFTNGQSWYDLAIEVGINNDDTVFVGGIGWFKSTNSGTSWTQIATGYSGGSGSLIHPDQHGLNLATSDKVVAGNDGGVVFSNDAGAYFSHRRKNLNITQFYNIGVAPTSAFSGEYIIGGTQDNGTQLFSNAVAGMNGSLMALGGDGAFSAFDQDGSDRYYIANYVYNNAIVLYNYEFGNSFYVNSENAANGDFINQATLDSNLNILYTNYSSGNNYKIRRYTINSLTGNGIVIKGMLENALLNSKPTALKVSPYTTSSSNLFVGLQNGRLLKVDNANATATWTVISPDAMIGSISDIEFGSNENEIFVTIHNYGVNSIWYTADGGNSWAQKEGNLPDLPVKCILQNPLKTDQVLIGTDLGTWWTEDFSSESPTWYHDSYGMGYIKVTDMVMRDDYKVYAATYGRGIFSGYFTTADGTSGIEDEILTSASKVYPNPVNHTLHMSFEDQQLHQPQIAVYDLNGRLILQQSSKDMLSTLDLDVQTLAPGSYLIKVTAQGKVYTNKFIKQ